MNTVKTDKYHAINVDSIALYILGLKWKLVTQGVKDRNL